MKLTKLLSLLLAILMIFGMAACGAETMEELPAAPAEAPAEAPAAPPAEGDVPVAAGEYTIGLIRDDVAKAELNIPSGKVVTIALGYAGKDSTVDFEVTGNTDETVATATADILTMTISGAKAGTSTVTASWTAVNTSGSTYTVEVVVTVNDTGTESFTELTTGDTAGGGASAEPASAEAPAPIGGSAEPSTMEPGGILFCGSSLMGGFRVVDTFLAQDGYEDISTGNISMGGTTIADFAASQKENIVAMNPGAIFINIGSVDVDRVASEVFDMQFMQDSYRELLTYLRDNLPECSIYVMAYYPSQENTFRPNALVDECNIWVEELANELGLNFVNVSGVLKNDKGYLREDYSADGIHLTDEAYRAVYDELKPALLASVGLE